MNKQLPRPGAQGEEQPLRTWKRPELRRLRAGAAELGGALSTDVGFAHS